MGRPTPEDISKSTDSTPPQKGVSTPTSAQISMTRQQLSYQSPLPPPEILERYNVIVASDAADRILRMVEKEQDHRHYRDKMVLQGNNQRANYGLIAGWSMLLLTLGTSVYMVAHGQAVAGITQFVLALAALVGVFVYGTNSRKEERAERTKSLTGKPSEPAKEDSPSKKLTR